MPISKVSIFLTIITLSLAAYLPAQNTTIKSGAVVSSGDQVSIFEHLNREEVLQLRLKTDLQLLIRHKSAQEFQAATLSYPNLQGNFITRNIEIKSRGNSRLQICSFPPLMLKFSEEDLYEKGKLKLVLTCEPGGLHEELVLREYLVYKLYNVLTDNSFRVQFAYLHLEDSEGKEKKMESYAFIIEDDDEMAERLKGQVIHPPTYEPAALAETSFDLMSMFQYVVGNTDWYVLNQHNLKLVQKSETNQVLAVPFDFDYAGIVNAPYALPHRNLPIGSVLKRYFIGECRDPGQYQETIRQLLHKKTAMYAVVENCTYLSNGSKKWMLKFLEKSFANLDDLQKMELEIAKGCGWRH